MSVTPLPPAPDPLDPNFDELAYEYTVAQTAMVPEMNQAIAEVNEALNLSLLGTTAASVTSMAITAVGTTKALNVTVGKGFKPGMVVKVAYVSDPTKYMKLIVTSYDINTGLMGGTVLSFNSSGTFANWSVFFDVQDQINLSVPTGEAVAAGNLLAIDDGGNSLAASVITPAVVQAVTAGSVFAVPLATDNVAIFWSSGNNITMMVVNRTGTPVVSPIVVASNNVNSAPVKAALLSNGNIALVYAAITTQYPTFKVVSPTGSEVVASTTIEASASSYPFVDGLTGGGFAVAYINGSSNARYALYTNTGTVAKNPTNTGTTSASYVNICEQPTSGGFVVLSLGTSGGIFHYDGAGTQTATLGLTIPSACAIAASGSTVASLFRQTTGNQFLGFSLGAYNANTTINGGNTALSWNDPINNSTALGITSLTVLGDGTYLGVFCSNSSTEYPRYVRFDTSGMVYDSGIIFDELPNASYEGVIIVPQGQNGFSLVWKATNGNIKFAHVKSGKLVGISLGQVGTNHQYITAGEKTLNSANRLNIGDAKINYRRMGKKVVI